MRRKAVQEDGVGRGLREKRFIHLKSREGGFARGGFLFLPHAGPHVGVNGLRAGHRFFRRAEDFDFSARFARDALCFGYNAQHQARILRAWRREYARPCALRR